MMKVTFYGVRGSLPTPGVRFTRYGGNTSCVAAFPAGSPDEVIIVDAGTGIRALGGDLLDSSIRQVHLFLTHFHWDHIQGLPFFAPLFDERFVVDIHSAVPADEIKEILSAQMRSPFFPVGTDMWKASVRYHRQKLMRGPIDHLTFQATAFPLNHPQGATGYRFQHNGASFAYVCDHECGDAPIDDGIAAGARDADLLIMDAQYTPSEFPAKIGWGHSTSSQAMQMAVSSASRQLALFHHDPYRTDVELDNIEASSRLLHPNLLVAREGMTLTLAGDR